MTVGAAWYDLTHWSGTTWSAAGVVVTLVLAFLGWTGRRAAQARSIRPLLTFAPLEFLGRGQAARPHYPFAIAFEVRNAGPGPALKIVVSFMDMAWENEKALENAPVFAEVVSRDVLMPGELLIDAAGLRGPVQDHDPTEADAQAFFHSCLANAVCWDARGRSYIFFPFGGGPTRLTLFRAPIARFRIGAWPRPQQMWSYLQRHPSRSEAPRALGIGPIADETDRGDAPQQ